MSDEWTISGAAGAAKVFDEQNPVRVVLSTEVEQKIGTLLEEFNDDEWMAGLVGTKEDGYYLISDLVIPEQEGSGAHIKATEKGVVELADTKLVGWLHSHNKMAAFQSGEDCKTAMNYELSITVNNAFDYFATLRVPVPVGGFVSLRCVVVGEARFFVDRDFLAKVKDKIKVVATSRVNYAPAMCGQYNDWDDFGNERGTLNRTFGEVEFEPAAGEQCGQCAGKFSKGKQAHWCSECSSPIHVGCWDAHKSFMHVKMDEGEFN